MRLIIDKLLKDSGANGWRGWAAISFCFLAYLGSLLHYNGSLPGNRFSWVFLLLSVYLLLRFSYLNHIKNATKSEVDYDFYKLIALAVFIYFAGHLHNWDSAPWNNFGLFDDAAWDIYFLKDKVLGEAPFQTIYFDNIGGISREALFHYYTALFFTFSGYNLQAFNFALLVLGFLSVLYITLSVYELTKSIKIAIFALLFAAFYPLIYTQTFQGHRYAIVPPLITMAYYYALLAYRRKSLFFAVLTGLFTSIAIQGGVAGKQFLLAGVMSLALFAFIYKRDSQENQKYTITLAMLLAFLIASIPLLMYVKFNADIYSVRESGLLKEFFDKLRNQGISGIDSYWQSFSRLFFAENAGERQFMGDYRPRPTAMAPAFIIGIFFAFIKKRYELIIFALLPIFSAFIAGSYDFRIGHAAPFFIILTFSIFIPGDQVFSNTIFEKVKYVTIASIALAAFSGAGYMLKIAKDANHIYLLPHIDVAVSRYMQDLAYGAKDPSIEMKPTEFNRDIAENITSRHDFFACPEGAFAIAHLYLKDLDDKKILSLCNGSISRIQAPNELINGALETLKRYDPHASDADLMLVWQKGEKVEPLLNALESLKNLAQITEKEISVDGRTATLLIVSVDAKNKADFKDAFLKAMLNTPSK